MAEKSQKNKSIIIGACVAVVVVIAIILAIVLINKNQGINDSYFVSDGTKYVLTMDMDQSDPEGDPHTPIKTHAVYFYKGNEITGLKNYLEYENHDQAKSAYEYAKENEGDSYKEILVDGKYVVLVADESLYENTTAEDVKQQIEFIESLKNFQFDDSDTEIIDEEVVVEEPTEEIVEEEVIVEE
ncbi:hypothetical protein IKF34_02360 [Candidatus Saccharibacteria bacterium]|nr:hypothetical protein [Candidatus Saccharibacteria bacterium]